MYLTLGLGKKQNNKTVTLKKIIHYHILQYPCCNTWYHYYRGSYEGWGKAPSLYFSIKTAQMINVNY